MSAHRVTPPILVEGEKAAGPASYFPSIETKYERPIQDWLDIAADLVDTRTHGEAVTVLKDDYGLGHGHANAIVAYVRANLGG